MSYSQGTWLFSRDHSIIVRVVRNYLLVSKSLVNVLVTYGSRTTSRRDFKPKGLQAEIKTLQAPQNTILSSVKRYFSKILGKFSP